MKKRSNVVASCLACAGSLLFITTPVLAATINVEGGVWNYGVGSKYVWSYYSHAHKTHKSSVHGKYDASSGWTRKGVKAKASAAKAIGGNEAYYDVMN